MEYLSGQQGQHCAFLAEGPADQGVDGDEKHELGDVLTQAQGNCVPGAFAYLSGAAVQIQGGEDLRFLRAG
ncbi:hypothetical protein NicSoilB8_01020 [Arthrobacter sp. NicSoilB8]|nr:hypothetical protein NicSoilB8_01020 [Arthrobacter sp. NicSoilB8]